MGVICGNDRAVAATGVDVPLAFEGCYAQGMVLQRGEPLNIRGRASPSATVSAQIANVAGEALADESGHWQIRLPAQPAGGPYALTISSDGHQCVLADIWIGEVWLCVGQSNLAWPFAYIPEQQRANYLKLIQDYDVRLMCMPERTFADASNPLPPLRWNGFKADEHLNLPALPTLLSRLIEKSCGCKVGIMVSAVAGSRSCSWIPREAYHEDAFLGEYLRNYPDDPPDYDQRMARWIKDKEAFHAVNQERQRKGEKPLPLTKYIFRGPRGTRSLAYPGGAFDAMIRPLAHLPVRGILWYQGESEAEIPAGYADRLQLLMRYWSSCWKSLAGQVQRHFVLVQLPGYNGDFEAKNWPHLREQQVLAVRGVSNAFCIPTTDLGEDSELHPSDKFAFAQRIAPTLAAISMGEIPQPAPCIEGYEVESDEQGDQLHLLVRLSSPVAPTGEPLLGFEIVDINGCTMAADAQVIDPTNLRIRVPIAPFAFRSLRYNWHPFPSGRLCGLDGMPLLPFRSDTAPPPYRANSLY